MGAWELGAESWELGEIGTGQTCRCGVGYPSRARALAPCSQLRAPRSQLSGQLQSRSGVAAVPLNLPQACLDVHWDRRGLGADFEPADRQLVSGQDHARIEDS